MFVKLSRQFSVYMLEEKTLNMQNQKIAAGGHIMSQAKPVTQELRPILESGDRLSRPEFERRYD